jgi:hypothetical protein
VLAFLMIVGIGGFVGSQLAHLAGELPGCQTNIAQNPFASGHYNQGRYFRAHLCDAE